MSHDMDAPPFVSPEDLAATPPSVLALIQWQARQIQRLMARVAELEAQVADLTARLNKTPLNSSLPPSSTHPHAKPLPPKSKSKRRRGGQPGHPKHERALVPVEQCQAVLSCVPAACRRCGQSLHGNDPAPHRHQVWELPEIPPQITEYQQHRLVCACGTTTCGQLPPGVPTGQAGPRLIAFAGLLMACFRQSKRRAALFLSMVLNQPACAGWLVRLQQRCADAVQPAYDDLSGRLREQPVQYIDESPNKEGTRKTWTWVFVLPRFTFFACRPSRGGEVLDDLLGAKYAGVIHCDRAKMYWRFGRLQWCWAHLKRDFQALIDGACRTAKRLGHDLMRPTKELFALWQRVRDGTLQWRTLVRRMQPLRETVNRLLLRGWCHRTTHGMCKELWTHQERLWTFLEVEGVEPTNNAAERALRHAVIWRKLSFGTQSSAGSRFVERMLTVIETCRRTGRNVFTWLTQAVQAKLQGQPGPTLL